MFYIISVVVVDVAMIKATNVVLVLVQNIEIAWWWWWWVLVGVAIWQ